MRGGIWEILLIAILLLGLFVIINIPINIAKNKGVTGGNLTAITILSWLGLFFGITWIIALILAYTADNNISELHLVLQHKWFDKIVSGKKKSEYRECSKYWNKRFSHKHYDTVVFHKGYTNVTAKYKISSIDITTKKNDLNLPKCWEIKLQKRLD